ncbi:MAG: NADH dehydrogenase [Candidatus Magasanikbacteria bacterium]|nr:NADH dehydrogenase [Candidatus Magasanikbacteria bacterium]
MRRVVIIGAGFAGLRLALDLSEYARRFKDAEIILIDQHESHTYTPLLYETATAFLEKHTTGSERELRTGASIPLVFAGSRVQFLECTVEKINRAKRTVKCSDGKILTYDYLALATGSVPNYFNIPGAKEHSYHLKTSYDALAIRRKLHDFVKQHCAGICERADILIGGGGATGVEFAGELATLFKHLVAQKKVTIKDYTITIVDAGDRLLGACSPQLSAWAEERLKKFGVAIRLKTTVQKAEHGRITVKGLEKTEILPAYLFVWAGGTLGNPLIKASSFQVTPKGLADVEPTLLIKGENRVFAIGDAAAFTSTHTGPAPALAQIAMQEGAVVARSIRNLLAGGLPERFHKPHWSTIIPVGGKFAMAEIGQMRFKGIAAYVLHKIADLRYFFSILPLFSALRVWWKGLLMYTKND